MTKFICPVIGKCVNFIISHFGKKMDFFNFFLTKTDEL